jgi:hypothetical protein
MPSAMCRTPPLVNLLVGWLVGWTIKSVMVWRQMKVWSRVSELLDAKTDRPTDRQLQNDSGMEHALHPEDDTNNVFRNVCISLQDYTASHLRKPPNATARNFLQSSWDGTWKDTLPSEYRTLNAKPIVFLMLSSSSRRSPHMFHACVAGEGCSRRNRIGYAWQRCNCTFNTSRIINRLATKLITTMRDPCSSRICEGTLCLGNKPWKYA